MLRRPKPGDTEEDLLLYQEEFLASKSSPAATVTKKRKPQDDEKKSASTTNVQTQKDVVTLEGTSALTDRPVKKSKFQEQQRKIDDLDAEEALDKHDTHITRLLSDIVERDFSNMTPYTDTITAVTGFPTAPHRGTQQNVTSCKLGKKKSVFAQQFAQRSPSDFGIKTQKPETTQSATEVTNQSRQAAKCGDIGERSRILTGKGLIEFGGESEAHKIHRENVDKLTSMSPEEIMKEREQLLTSLEHIITARKRSLGQDPNLIAFLKSKRGGTSSTEEGMIAIGTEEEEKPKVVKEEDEPTRSMEVKEEWVHMDTSEPEKLSWIGDLPPPPKPSDLKTGRTARFDLEGYLVAPDADIPTHLGLHHHGDQPERAGYSVEEFYQLGRSANMQQRALALNTVAKIIRRARRGEFTDSVQTPIIPALLDGGLVFILRWSLDDTIDTTIAAAVNCFHSLLVSEQDEEAADCLASWHSGSELPSLSPAPWKRDIEPEDKDEKMTDAQLAAHDVIQALLKMNFVERLRYTLEVVRPHAPVVIHILQILNRIVRHSVQTAYQLTLCPRLVDTVFNEFLPTTWEPIETGKPISNMYSLPSHHALKFVRLLCTMNYNIAASLEAKYHIMNRVARYLAETTSALQLNEETSSKLQLESWRTWHVLTQYALSTHYYSELYSMLARNVQIVCSSTMNSPVCQLGSACCVVNVLESFIYVANSTAHLSSSRKTEGPTSSRPLPSVNWSQIVGMVEPLQTCMTKQLKEFQDEYTSKTYDLNLLSCLVNFMATYFSCIESMPGYDAIETVEQLGAFTDTVLLPCMKGLAYRRAVQYTREKSIYVMSSPTKNREIVVNLPQLGDIGSISNAPGHSSELPFTLALTRLCQVVCKLCKCRSSVIVSELLNDEMLLYIRKCCRNKTTAVALSPWTRSENLLHWYIIQASKYTDTDVPHGGLLHHLALSLMTHLHQGDEHIAHDLLSHVIFNQRYLGDLASDKLLELSDLRLDEREPLSSATQENFGLASKAQLAEDIRAHLVAMRGSHMTAATPFINELPKSRNRHLHNLGQMDTLQTGLVGQLLLPIDWVYLPIIELYNAVVQMKGQWEEQSVTAQALSIVTDVLRCVFMLETWRPSILQSVSFATKLSRLYCLFLAGSDLFLNSTVHMYLSALLSVYCKAVHLDKINFTEPVPGLASFYDLFVMVLQQYEAVSFGDAVFGCYVLLPMQQQHATRLRSAVWSEHNAVISALIVPLQQIPIPVQRFLEPEETNIGLIRLYIQNLLNQQVVPRRCPLPYLVAVHHTNRFIYTQDNKHNKLKNMMLKQVAGLSDQVLKLHILNYKKFNIDCQYGIELYEELPTRRQETINKAIVTR